MVNSMCNCAAPEPSVPRQVPAIPASVPPDCSVRASETDVEARSSKANSRGVHSIRTPGKFRHSGDCERSFVGSMIRCSLGSHTQLLKQMFHLAGGNSKRKRI